MNGMAYNQSEDRLIIDSQIQMKSAVRGIDAPSELIANKVTAVFQSPSHYTLVLQHHNGIISLYDEKAGSIVGCSKKPLQALSLLAFCKNYGEFYVYCEAPVGKTTTLVMYKLTEEGHLAPSRHILKEKTVVISPSYCSMGTLMLKDQNQQQVLVFLSISTFSLVAPNGELISTVPLEVEGRKLNALKSYQIKENKFLIVQQHTILTGFIWLQSSDFKQQLRFLHKIEEVFMDSAIHRNYLGILTHDQILHIARIRNDTYKICHTVTFPSFTLTRLSFFYPGINSSPCNRYKDRVYVVFQGMPTIKLAHKEKQSKKPEDSNMLADPQTLYIHEFKQSYLGYNQQVLKLKPMNQFYVDNVGIAKTIFFNDHDLNCIRVLDESGRLQAYRLSFLFDSIEVDAEWIYLAYRFEHCSKGQSITFEAKEDHFESQPVAKKSETLSERELDDWSYSCFDAEELAELKKRRWRCISYN